jgi:hypothetical protein
MQTGMKQQRLDDTAARGDVSGLNLNELIKLQVAALDKREKVDPKRKLKSTGHWKSHISIVGDSMV